MLLLRKLSSCAAAGHPGVSENTLPAIDGLLASTGLTHKLKIRDKKC